MSEPLVTVVIPLYNKASTIARSIASALDQSWTNLELVVVDDGSTDDFKPQIAQFLEDPRVRLVAKPNGGLGGARNSGVQAANGAYIAFLDADDAFTPGHIREGMDVINGRTNIIYYTQVLISRDGVNHVKPSRGYDPSEAMSEYWSISFGFMPPQSLIMDRGTAVNIPWNEERWIPEDYDYALRAREKNVSFVFNETPAVIVYHEYDEHRLSNLFRNDRLKLWASQNRRRFSRKGYLAYFGSTIAVHEKWKIVGCYRLLRACANGCFDLKNAIRIAMQILLSRKRYIALVDYLIKTMKVEALFGQDAKP